MAAEASEKKTRSQSVQRGLEVLTCFLQGDPVLGVTELATRTRLPKTIVHRLVTTLAVNGFLERDTSSAKYRVGPMAFRVGACFLRGRRLETEALPIMRKVVEKCGLPSHLAILHGDEGIIVAMVDNPLPVKVTVHLGARRDLHATAIGKAMLAFQPPEETRAILGRITLVRRTSHTITGRRALLKELEQVRRQGYAFNNQEANLGVQAIAAPIFAADGSVRAALGIPFPVTIVPPAEIKRLADLAMEAAKEVSARLGGG